MRERERQRGRVCVCVLHGYIGLWIIPTVDHYHPSTCWLNFVFFLLKPHFVVQSSESRPVPLWMNYFLVKEEDISVVISLFSDPYLDSANSSCGWSTVWESRPVPLWMNYFLVKEENISAVISLFSDPYLDLANSSCGWSTVWLLMGSVTSVWFSSVQLDLFIFQIFIDFRRWTCWLWMVGC